MVSRADHAGGVVLAQEKPGERGCEHFRAFHFGSPSLCAAIFHRSAGVTDNIEPDVRLEHVTFDAETVVAGVEAPIEMAQIIAGLIVAIIAELDAEPVKRAVVQAAEKSLHDVARLEIESFERGQQLRIEAFGQGL